MLLHNRVIEGWQTKLDSSNSKLIKNIRSYEWIFIFSFAVYTKILFQVSISKTFKVSCQKLFTIIMKKLLLTGLSFLFICLSVFSQQKTEKTNKASYQLAARFSPNNLKKMIFSTTVSPNWLPSGKFWYSYSTPNTTMWYIVDAEKEQKSKLFDNADLAAKLSLLTQDPHDSKHLKLDGIKFTNDENRIRFEVKSNKEVLKTEKERKDSKSKTDSLKKKTFYLEYDLRTTRLTELNDSIKPKPQKSWASFSPDTTVIIYAKNYNLYWMDRENYKKAQEDEKDSSIVEHQFTTDGIKDYAWGGDDYSFTTGDTVLDKRKGVRILWSPNGKQFILTRKDDRDLNDLWVIHSVGSGRPKLETYKYQMPGENDSTRRELYLFDFQNKTHKEIDVSAFKNQNIGLWSEKIPKSTPDDAPRILNWLGSNDNFYIYRTSRDQKRIDLLKVNVNGKTEVMVEERSNVYLDIQRPLFFNNGKEFAFWSERDGWGHLYLYDSDGKLKNQITKGEFFISGIEAVDEKTRRLFFTANGKEQDENPYYNHLYSINLDGSGLSLLNKGNFDHQIDFNDAQTFYVDNYSRVNTVPETGLFNRLGKKVMNLEKADLTQLFEAGYKFPEPFTVKADDGVTDLYGVMYKPFDFDSTKKYPLIEYVYPGPQTEAVNASFGRGMDRTDRLAQLGFVVITVGNRGGHPARSKWYHTYGYGNLRNYGLSDKKAAAEQIAYRNSFIDINKIGITGHSGGGFMSTAAMLVYPDFFKVAVSGSSNHENNIYNRNWSERHHGVLERISPKGDTTFTYNIDKNSALAKNLKGNLMMATGDIDNNVHPANTIRMADALIKANKRFDFVLMPEQRHGYGNMTEYFFWKLGEYFAEHLLGDYRHEADIIEIQNDIPQN